MKKLVSLLLGTTLVLTAASSNESDKKPVAPVVDSNQMVQISASTFNMGIADETGAPYGNDWLEDQQPQHSVTLDTFWMDKYEVTAEEFALFLTYAGGKKHFHRDQPIEPVKDGYLPIKGREQDPMHQVTWEGAAEYCAWAGKRLPTEAEWERAAAGIEGRIFPWGDGYKCNRAVYFAGNTTCQNGNQPLAVGSRAGGATPEGIFDLAGNVAEWTADWYGRYTRDKQTNPTGPAKGTLKIIRGGSFLDSQMFFRTRARVSASPQARADSIGFRCVWSAEDTTPILRGKLTPPADEDRQPSPRPYTSANKDPEILVSGLSSPGAIVDLGTSWYVIETGAKQVVAIDKNTKEVKTVLSGLTDPVGLATDGQEIFVTDRAAGKIWRVVTNGTSSVLVEGEDAPALIAVKNGDIFWSTKSAIRALRYNNPVAESLVTDLDGITGISLSSTHLFFAEAGATNEARTRIGKIALTDGTVQTIADYKKFAYGYYWVLPDPKKSPVAVPYIYQPSDLVVDEEHNLVLFSSTQRKWPVMTLLNGIDPNGGNIIRLGSLPQGAGKIAIGGNYALVSGSQTLSRMAIQENSSYDVPGYYTSVGGMIGSESNIIWTDSASGNIHRETFQ